MIEIEIEIEIEIQKMDPLGPMEARPTCFSTLLLNYFQDLENDPGCNFDESESFFSRNGLTANRFIKKRNFDILYIFDNFDNFDNGPLGAHGGKADLLSSN